jgi:hypothetical protein
MPHQKIYFRGIDLKSLANSISSGYAIVEFDLVVDPTGLIKIAEQSCLMTTKISPTTPIASRPGCPMPPCVEQLAEFESTICQGLIRAGLGLGENEPTI